MSTQFPVDIAEWPRNDREVVRVRLDQYQGHPTIDIRTWFTGPEGNLRPGKGGITLGIRHLPALASGIAAALAQAKLSDLVGATEGDEQ